MSIIDSELLDVSDRLIADRIRAFTAFARLLNFTHAAKELGFSQPAVYKKIRDLEDYLGVPLYFTNPERKNEVMGLTPEGERLVTYAEDNIRLAQDALASLRGTSGGPLTVAAGRGAYLYVISDALRKLSKRKGGIRAAAASNAEAIQQVRQGRADIAIVGFSEPPDDLARRTLASYPPTLIIRKDHRLANKRALTLPNLDGLELALPGRGEPMREYLGNAFANAGITTSIVAEALNWDLLIQFVTFGVEATIVNSFNRPPRGYVAIPITDLQQATYYAAWRPERQSLADEFLASLK